MFTKDDEEAARRDLEAAKQHLKNGQIGPELPKPLPAELARRKRAVERALHRLLFVQQERSKDGAPGP